MSTDDPIAEPQKERPPGAPQEPAPEAEKPPPLLRNTDRSKLPAAKREQWSLRPATWAEYSEEERKLIVGVDAGHRYHQLLGAAVGCVPHRL